VFYVGGGRRVKAEPSTADPSGYYADSNPDTAIANAVLPGAHAAGGQAGVGIAIAN